MNDLFVWFDFCNYSFSFTVKPFLSTWWASESNTVSLIIIGLPAPHMSLILLPPAATEFFLIHFSYLLFISSCVVENCLTKLSGTLLKNALASETVSDIFFLVHGPPDLSTGFHVPGSLLDSWGCHINEYICVQAGLVKWVHCKHTWFV